jgi:DNA-binding MarR family transcriptional regulator
MMAMVDRLQRRHLLFRTRSKVDRRRQELYLTDEGRAVHAEAVRLIQAHEKQFTSRFSPAELQQLLSLLRRIHGEAGEA